MCPVICAAVSLADRKISLCKGHIVMLTKCETKLHQGQIKLQSACCMAVRNLLVTSIYKAAAHVVAAPTVNPNIAMIQPLLR